MISHCGLKIGRRDDGRQQGQRRPEEGDQHGKGGRGHDEEAVREADEKHDADRERGLNGRQDHLGAQESPERRRDGPLEHLCLVRVPTRNDPIEAGQDALAVGQHVQAEDDHEEKRSEDRDRDRRRLPQRRPDHLNGGRLHVAIEAGEIGLELADRNCVLPVRERGLEPFPRLREVRGRLPDRRANGRGGVEQQGPAHDEGRGIHHADGDTTPDARLLDQPRDDGRQHERQQPGREEDQEDLREAAEHLEQQPDQEQGEVGGRDDEQQ